VILLSLLVDAQTYFSHFIKPILFFDLVHEISQKKILRILLCALNCYSILYFIILYFILSRHLSSIFFCPFLFYFVFFPIQIKKL